MRKALARAIFRAAPAILLGLVTAGGARADTAGPNPAGTSSSSDWFFPDEADGAPDSLCATATQTGEVILLTNFGFSLPAGATIDGIEVEAKGGRENGGNLTLRLTKDGSNTVGSARNASLGSSLTCASTTFAGAGGTSDLWGTTWSEAEVESSSFGVIATSTAASVLDAVRITITFTAPDTPTATSTATQTATATATPTATGTATDTPSATMTDTPTATATATSTDTPTASPTATATDTPTATATATDTPTPQPNGASCSGGGQCISGNCSDGVCCDTACSRSVERCDLPSSLGICVSFAAPAPALSPSGVLGGLAILMVAGALALARRTMR